MMFFGYCFFCSGIFASCVSAKANKTPYFVSGSDMVDFVTSHERCFQHGGNLATFPQTDDYDASMGLEARTFYWVEGKGILKINAGLTCLTLVIDDKLAKYHLVDSNCANKYKYICTKKDTTIQNTFNNRITESTISVSNAIIKPTSTLTFTETLSVQEDIGPSFSGIKSTLPNTERLGIENAVNASVLIRNNSYVSSKVTTTQRKILYSCLKDVQAKTGDPINENCNEIEYADLCMLCGKFNHKTLMNNFTDLYNISNTTNLNLFPELEINIQSTSKAHRKKISASDPRPSTRAMGLAASFVIGSVVIVIVILDLPVILSQFRRFTVENAKNVSEC